MRQKSEARYFHDRISRCICSHHCAGALRLRIDPDLIFSGSLRDTDLGGSDHKPIHQSADRVFVIVLVFVFETQLGESDPIMGTERGSDIRNLCHLVHGVHLVRWC